MEACSFRDANDEFEKKNIKLLGVSVDDEKAHQKFRSKYGLQFDLVSDTDKDVVQKYGVWAEKSMYGKKYMGIERTTFIIDEQGKISHIFPKVKVTEHYEEVLQALKE